MAREPQFADSKTHGYFKAVRSDDALELVRLNPFAFMLAYFIAYRARYRDGFNADNLQPGEALLGDFKSYGMTEQLYRTAKRHLQKFNFATFRTTNRGTIGKLMDTRLFDPLNVSTNGQINDQSTDSHRAANGQPTTNNKVNKVERKEALPPSREVESDFVKSLQESEAYKGIDVRREFEKAKQWILAQGGRRQFTKRFFVNWLNRVEQPITINGKTTPLRTGNTGTLNDGKSSLYRGVGKVT